MNNAIFSALKIFALTAVQFILFAVAGTLLGAAPDQASSDQSGSALALLVVCLLNTLVLTMIIRNSVWNGWKLVGAVFVVFYGIMTFMSQIEAAVFPTQLPPGMVWNIFLMGVVIAAPFSVLSVLILGKWRGDERLPARRDGYGPTGWTWRLAAIVAAYLFFYFSFGYFVAWQDPAIREYYGGTDPEGFFTHMAGIIMEAPWLIFFQIFRAFIWAAIAWTIVVATGSKKLLSPLAVALAFAVLMNAQLLLPNPYMPEAVRMAHLMETASSNFLFGLLAGWLLLDRRGKW